MRLCWESLKAEEQCLRPIPLSQSNLDKDIMYGIVVLSNVVCKGPGTLVGGFGFSKFARHNRPHISVFGCALFSQGYIIVLVGIIDRGFEQKLAYPVRTVIFGVGIGEDDDDNLCVGNYV